MWSLVKDWRDVVSGEGLEGCGLWWRTRGMWSLVKDLRDVVSGEGLEGCGLW